MHQTDSNRGNKSISGNGGNGHRRPGESAAPGRTAGEAALFGLIAVPLLPGFGTRAPAAETEAPAGTKRVWTGQMAVLKTMEKMSRRTCDSSGRNPARRFVRGLAGKTSLLILFALAASPVLQGNVRVPEYEAKAAFMYNFFRFVDWPDDVFDNEEDPFRIGVLGIDPFGPYLDEAVRDRTIDSRAIEVVRFSRLRDVEGVHMLYVSESERNHLAAIMERLASRPILTVGDVDGFAAHGGIVEFFFRDQRIAFRINHIAAQRAGLSMSARLLSLAVLVDES